MKIECILDYDEERDAPDPMGAILWWTVITLFFFWIPLFAYFLELRQ